VSTLIHEGPAMRGTRVGTGTSLARLFRLHLISRRVPTAMVALAICAPLLQVAVRSALSQRGNAGATTSAEQLGLLLEAAAAAVVSAALHGPFGESERIAGRRLDWLRLITTLLLTATALGAVSVGVAATGLPSGEFAALRDTAGLIGIGIVCAVIVGGHFAWVGPAAYSVVGAYALTEHWQTPWTWPARPGGDVGAALCAFAVLAVSLLAVTLVGPRQHDPE
jgi:hypothetical protein